MEIDNVMKRYNELKVKQDSVRDRKELKLMNDLIVNYSHSISKDKKKSIEVKLSELKNLLAQFYI